MAARRFRITRTRGTLPPSSCPRLGGSLCRCSSTSARPVFLPSKRATTSMWASRGRQRRLRLRTCSFLHLGTVAEITSVMLTGGQMTQAVVIDSDGKMETDPNIYPRQPFIQGRAGESRPFRRTGWFGRRRFSRSRKAERARGGKISTPLSSMWLNANPMSRRITERP